MSTLQTGYVIHTRPYLESSVLAELFTRQQGRLTVIARGIKRNKAQRGLLSPFQKLHVVVKGRGELPTLSHLETVDSVVILKQLPLYCGYYVNELILKLLAPRETCETLFAGYELVIKQLAALDNAQRHSLEICLREFEFSLLQELGKSLDFLVESHSGRHILADRRYWVGFNQGISATPVDGLAEIRGSTLIAIGRRDWLASSMTGAKLINRFFIDQLLNNKVLHSRKMIRDYLEVMSEN